MCSVFIPTQYACGCCVLWCLTGWECSLLCMLGLCWSTHTTFFISSKLGSDGTMSKKGGRYSSTIPKTREKKIHVHCFSQTRQSFANKLTHTTSIPKVHPRRSFSADNCHTTHSQHRSCSLSVIKPHPPPGPSLWHLLNLHSMYEFCGLYRAPKRDSAEFILRMVWCMASVFLNLYLEGFKATFML